MMGKSDAEAEAHAEAEAVAAPKVREGEAIHAASEAREPQTKRGIHPC